MKMYKILGIDRKLRVFAFAWNQAWVHPSNDYHILHTKETMDELLPYARKQFPRFVVAISEYEVA